MKAKQASGRYAVAAVSERRVAEVLNKRSPYGHHILQDRLWPGSRRANVDHIVVATCGVFINDTKACMEVRITDGDGRPCVAGAGRYRGVGAVGRRARAAGP